jgi:hypothetical protein
MIDCLKIQFLEFVKPLIDSLSSMSHPQDISGVVRILNQLMSQFKVRSHTHIHSGKGLSSLIIIVINKSSLTHSLFLFLLLFSLYKQEKMLVVVDALFLRLVEKLFSVIGQLHSNSVNSVMVTSSELRREIQELEREYFNLISSICSNGLSQIFVSESK